MYRVVTGERIILQLDGLPELALTSFAELRVTLELNPWSRDPANPANPHSAVRTMTFGPNGQDVAACLILEDQRRVDIVQLA